MNEPAAGRSARQSHKTAREVPKQIWIPALVFTGLLLLFFVLVFLWFDTLSPDRRDLLRILTAFAGGFAALFMGGTISLHLDVPRKDLGKAAVSATSGIALFLFLYLVGPFWYKTPEGPPPPPPVVDNSDLTIRLDRPEQGVPLIRAPQHYQGNPVFCETVRTGVVISHSQGGERPIRLTRLALETEPVIPTPKELDCTVNVLRLKPHGIQDIDQYFFDLMPGRIEARYLKSLKPEGALRVAPQNIFESTRSTKAVEITAKGEDAHYQIVSNIQALARGLYRARFDAEYDIAGEPRSKRTEWLYVYKK